MQARLDIPRTVWTWRHYPVVIVWGTFSLHAIVAYARKLLPLAPCNNQCIRSDSFAIVAFEKTANTLDKIVYGGQPILIYNVRNSMFSAEQVLEHLAREYASLLTGVPPVVLLHFNDAVVPKVPGFKFSRATEGETQSLLHVCKPLTHETILNQTNSLKLDFVLEGDEEEEDGRIH